MKLLTFLKLRPGPLPQDPNLLIGLNEASKQWIRARLDNGTLDCGYNVLPSAAGYYGMGIGNYDSVEEGYRDLTTYPLFLFTDFEVYPLSDVFQAIDDVSAGLKQLGGGPPSTP